MTGLAQTAAFCLIFGGSVFIVIGAALVLTMDIAPDWAAATLMITWVVFGWLFLIVGAVLGLIALGMLAFS